MNLRTRPPAEKCSEKSTKLSVLNSPLLDGLGLSYEVAFADLARDYVYKIADGYKEKNFLVGRL